MWGYLDAGNIKRASELAKSLGVESEFEREYKKRKKAGEFRQHGRFRKSSAEREQREQLMFACLDDAEKACLSGDIREEEGLIREALVHAEALRARRKFDEELVRRAQARRLRRCEYFGYVGEIGLFSDRLIDGDGNVWVVDENLVVSVETSGSINTTTRPTLTRMAVGSLLPGSALIPGFAFQKTKTHDERDLYVLLEHPEYGAAAIPVDPTQEAAVRQLAGQLRAAVQAHKLAREQTDYKTCPDCAEQVKAAAKVCRFCGYRFE